MKAIIQAGGKGTRLRNITKDEIPKPMVPILGKSLLQWQIEKLKENGITEIGFIIGHLGKVIQDYFGDGRQFGVYISYYIEEAPLGTGGGLYYLKEFVSKEEEVLFLYGDVFFDVDISRMEQFHLEHKAGITAFVHPNSHPYDSDIMEIDKDQRVTEILSKKTERTDWYHNLVNAAFYMINGSVIHDLTELKKMDFEKEILCKRIQTHKDVYGYRSTEFVKDAGTEERLVSIEKDISSGYITKKNLRYSQKCIFLDRDGTINDYKGLISKEEDFELIADAADAIKKINRSEYLVICATNQPVVARGLCDIEDVERIHKKIQYIK